MSTSKTTATSLDPSRPKPHRTLPEDHAAQRLQEAILHPGSVKINVKGAFIVDEQPAEQQNGNANGNGNGNGASFGGGDGIHYEHKDIRLPHHTDVVSHVAVDVSSLPSSYLYDGHLCILPASGLHAVRLS